MAADRASSVDRGTMAAGTLLGRYELLGRIASGGMATVYQARARGAAGFERIVAIKCCHPHLRDEPAFAAMFLDEARLAAGIHHPNVVATLDVAEVPALYLVMDYVEGDSLGALIGAAIRADGGLAPGVALRVLVDALRGLHAAHTLCDEAGKPLGIVHRDVSPQNVLVGVDGVARLTDFGVARAEARLAQTHPGELKGKLGYMPPEQLARQPVTLRGDIYSAGVVLWEALTGYRLFGDASGTRSTPGTVVPPSEAEPTLPAVLDAITMRALDADPSRRFATAAEFADALEASGVALASPRVVGDLVARLLAGPLAQRRAARRGASPAAATPAPADEFVSDTQRAPGVFGEEITREKSRRSALGVAAVALVAGAFGAVVAMRSIGRATVTPVPAPSAVVAPATARPVAAPPAFAAPPTVAPTPTVAAALPETNAPAAAPPREPHHRHARGEHHRAPTPRATTHHPGSREYDPGAV